MALNKGEKADAPFSPILMSISGGTGAALLLSALTLVANVLLFRTLSVGEAGLFSKYAALVPILALLGGLGQQGYITRKYSLETPGFYSWKAGLANLFRQNSLFLLLVLVGAYIIYQPLPLHTVYIVAAAVLLLVLQSATNILNASQFYILSSILIRLPNSFILVPALIFVLAPGIASLDIALFWHLLGLVLVLGLTLQQLSAKVPISGDRQFLDERKVRLGLWLLAMTNLMTGQGILAIAGSAMDPEMLAGFGAVEVLLRPLYLLQNILMRVYLIEIPRDSKFNFRLALAAMLGGIAIIVIAYILLGPIAINLFFSDAYLSSIPLILPLTLLGAFVVLESLPRSAILSHHNTSTLPYFVLGHVLIAVSGLVAIIYASNELTLAHCAWIGAAIGLLRVILTFSTFVKTRQERRRAITS